MSDDIEELQQRMVDAPPRVQIDFLLRSLENAETEQERLRAVVEAARAACQTFGDWWMSDERNESDTNSLTRSMNVLLSALKDIGEAPDA